MPRRRRALVLLALGFLGALGALATAALAAGPDPGTLRYEWSIADRYGVDTNGDEVVDNHDGITNLAADKDFVQNPTYALTFDTCASPAVTGRNELIKTYKVTLTGPATVTKSGTSCKVTANVTKLGSYTAKVELLSELGTVYDTRVETIEPKDHFVVSVGDSVASGEGNPDRLEPALPTFDPIWQNKQCHRTGLAGPAQAALRMERRDPHSTVTFVHLACSGASIEEGLIGSYGGIDPGAGTVLRPQLDVLEDLAGTRQVDALLVSIGANDAKFSNVVKACLLMTNCHTDSVPGVPNAKQLFDKELPNLDRAFPLLDARLDKLAASQGGKPPVLKGKAFFTQYYDVTKNDTGQHCTGLTKKEVDAGRQPNGQTTDGINQAEMQWADAYVQDGLNANVKSKLDAANGTGGSQLVWVDGIKAKFSTHGYCAQDRWVRTLFESGLYQRGVDGAFHPNAEGQLHGYATSIEERVAPVIGVGGTALPVEADATALAAGDALASWVGILDKTGGLDAITNALPLGARETVQTWIRDKFFGKFVPWLQDRVEGAGSLTSKSEKLDDPDGDGNPDQDGLPVGVDLDVTGDIQPKLPSKQYDITLTFKGSVGLEPDLALKVANLGVTDQKVDGKATFEQTVKLHLDFTKPIDDSLRLTIPQNGLTGTIKVGLGADFGGTDGPANGVDRPPLSFSAGILGLTATGPAGADLELGYKVQDPSGDGRIDATEIGNPLDWVRFDCRRGAANVHLRARAALAGLPADIGSIRLQDADLCDGVDPPQVEIASLPDFTSLTAADLINGLAQLTQSLQSLQQTGDVDLPFVKEALSEIVSVNDKLVKFFVDAGLTDPAKPMANITFDPAKRPDLDTIGEIAPKVAEALGVTPAGLNLRYDAGRLLFDVGITRAPAPLVAAGTIDVGDQLDRVGLVGVTGSAKATVEPSFAVSVPFGIDLRPDLTFAQRFFFKAGASLTADAKITADAQLTGTLAILDVALEDTNPAGPITLLDRKDPAKPLVKVELVEPVAGDDRVTLEELSTPALAATRIKATVNGKVPAFGLKATASLGGFPLAGGTLNVAWPDITKTDGLESLSVTADDTFLATLAPFAFDLANPRAAIGQILTATQRGVAGLRGVLAKDPELIAGLPLVGKSAAELDPALAKLDAALARLVELNESLTLERAEAELEKAMGEALGVANDKLAGLVTVRLEKQTETPRTNAAIVADLNLGLCTDDRTATVPPEPAGPAGCSHTVARVDDHPFTLQLGDTSDSSGLLGAGASGNVSVSFDARLRLSVGVELPRVGAPTTPGGPPTFTGSPQLFVLDTSSFELGLGASVAATLSATVGPVNVNVGTEAQPATARLAARYKLISPTAVPAAPVRKRAGTELTAWLATLDPDPTTPGRLHDTVYPSGCAGGADACATLPVLLGNAPLGPITFTAPDLLDPAGWTVDADAVVNSLSSEAFQFQVLLEGVRSFALRIENSLRNLPQGTRIPLLGASPTAGAEVLADFRTNVVEPFQDLVLTLQAKGNTTAVHDEVQNWLYAKIGPEGADLLKDTNGNGTVTKDDVVVDVKCKVDGAVNTCAAGESILKLEDLQIKAKLAKEASGATAPFDSGFPGLRLSSKTGFAASIGFELDLAIGVDRTNGFYVRTNAFGSAPELRVAASASLPDQVTGQIAFIPVAVRDLRPDAPDVKATFGLDLSLGGNDGKMGLGQIGQAQLTPRFSACANVQLGLVTGGQAGGNGKLPSFLADLKLTGGLDCTGDAETGAGAATSFNVAFENVRVDVGSLVNEFIGPAVRSLRKFTGPLEPTIDAIREPIPGVAQAARAVGLPEPTWWDLLTVVNDVGKAAGKGDQLKMIKTVIAVIDLTRSLDGVNGNGHITLGSFKLNVGKASEPISSDRVGELLTSITETPGGPLLDRLTTSLGVPVNVKAKLQDKATSGITFPALERPSRLFEMLLGKDVPLVRFEAAGNFLHVPIGPFSFPIGPATVYFGGSLDLSGHFAAGFDTYGIRKSFALLSDDDPSNDSIGNVGANLLGGFYFDDYDANGKDVPELKATAKVVVGAGFGVPGFLGAFVEGGVGADASLDLKTEDGKLRPEQLITQLKLNPNPVCIFQARARIYAFLQLIVTTPLFDIEFPIADVTILDEPDLTDFCNTQQDDTQQKLTGRLYVDGLLEVFASPEADRITVTQTTEPGVVEVSSMGVVEPFEGVTKIFVDGAAGDDTVLILAAPVLGAPPPPIPVVLCGGQGKDRLTTEAGPGALHGDDGPGVETTVNDLPTLLPCTAGPGAADTLTGGPGVDVLEGGDGNDTLLGADGNDQLVGGPKDDVLLPGAGDDKVQGGDGRDTISSTDRPRLAGGVTTNLRTKRSGATGTAEKDVLLSIESAYGSAGDDELLTSDLGTIIDGFGGEDVLTGGRGPDILVGGDGDDLLLGGEGFDTLTGVGGNDRIVGGPGPDLHMGGYGFDISDWSNEPGPVLVDLNGKADDGATSGDAALLAKDNVDTEVVWGTTAGDELRAGTTPATLEGRGGDDLLFGPGRLLGADGDDRLRGGPGEDDDVLDGGPGIDDLQGRDGHDLLDGGTESDNLEGGNGPDVLDAGSGSDNLEGGDGTDGLSAGDGDDRLDGGLLNDSMSGGAGFDTVDYSMRPGGVELTMVSGDNDREVVPGGGMSPDCTSVDASTCDDVMGDNERILGGQGGDRIWGTTGPQLFLTGTGPDFVDGEGGIDHFDGGPGDDRLEDGDQAVGIFGFDSFLSGDGDDWVAGIGGATVDAGSGNNTVNLGGDFDDVVTAGPGDDTVSSEGGNDTVELGDGNNWWTGRSGSKLVNGGSGRDVVSRYLSDGPSTVRLGGGNDEFNGSDGDDTVDGGPGDDALNGGGGNDRLTDLEGANGVSGGTGNDVIRTGPGVEDVRAGDGNDDVSDTGSDGRPRPGWTSKQNLWGDAGNDVIHQTGGGVAGELRGGDGDDQLFDGSGSNEVFGDPGLDVLDAGAGDDRLDGGGGDDTLLGGPGDDILNAGAGTNLLDGGTGADTANAEGNGIDTFTYESRTEPLAVTQQGVVGANDGSALDQSATVPGKRDDLGSAVERIIGGRGDDAISLSSLATSGENGVIEGRGGNDVISASALTNAAHVTTLLGGDGDDVLVGSTGADTLQAGNGADLVRGGPGADVVQGEAGDDRLDEGAATSGADKLSGGADLDAVDYSGRTAAVTVSIGNGVADDGQAAEGDEVLDAESARIGAASAPAKPTVTLTAAKGSSVSGELVDWTAVVTQPAGQPAATGSIALSDGNVSRSFPLDGTGRAVAPVALKLVGTRTVTAAYSGDARYLANSSAGVAHTVAKAATTTALSVIKTPVATGTQVEVTATVSPTIGTALPTGVVDVREAGVKLGGLGLVDGRGSLKLTLAAGSHELVAVYPGDSVSLASTSAPLTALVVDGGVGPAPEVALSTVPAAPVAGSPLNVTATTTTVAGVPRPVGAAVRFTTGDPATELGTAVVQPDGTATLVLPAGLAGGSHPVTASVAGTAWTAPGQVTSTIVVARTATTTAMTSAANPSPVGSGLSVTATVARAAGTGAPTGTVTFLDGDRVLGTAELSGGTATKLVTLTAGSHSLTARYEGTELLAPSLSPVLAQVVGTPAAATTTALVRKVDLLVATVSGPAPAITGQVRFVVDGIEAATVAVGAGGRATLPVAGLTPGTRSVVAEYVGTATHLGSASAALSVKVKVASTTALTREGDRVVATVTGPAPAITGRVRFLVDGAEAAKVTVGAGGRATMLVTGLTAGTRSVVAEYLGSDTHLPSASPALSVEVLAASATALVREGDVLAATVTGPAPAITGQVRFFVDGAAVATVAVDAGGRATIPVAGLAPGTRSVVAKYLGSATHQRSASPALAVEVA